MSSVPVSDRVASPTDIGFRTELHGMSLYDLVQLECNRSTRRRVVCVLSGSRTGHIYFDGGQVVHAITDVARGEEALFEILGWSAGVSKEVSRSWPEASTIRASWQSLLMRAVYEEDEQRRSGTDSSPRLRVSREPVVVDAAPVSDEPVDDREGGDIVPGPKSAVRLGRAGSILRRHGDVEELAATSAFVGRLVELIGESLGIDGFMQLEIVRKSSRLVVAADGSDLVATLGDRNQTAEELRAGANV